MVTACGRAYGTGEQAARRTNRESIRRMQAVIRRNGKLIVDQMADLTAGPGQMLVKTLVCGICGSDLHALDHYDHMIDLSSGMGGISLAEACGLTLPELAELTTANAKRVFRWSE